MNSNDLAVLTILVYESVVVSGYIYHDIVGPQYNEILSEYEARNNLVGFFELLLRVDKRINPQNYERNRD